MQKKSSRAHTLLTLFFSMLSISAFTFGGGFVIVTLMKQKFVDKLHWLDETEMLDMTAIAQSSPRRNRRQRRHSGRLAHGGLCRNARGRCGNDSSAHCHSQRDFAFL